MFLTLEAHFSTNLYQQVGVTTRGSGGRTPTAAGEQGFGGGAPGRCGNFTAFFLKKYAFLGIFLPKFLLKKLFFYCKCLNKVCWCAFKACASRRIPPPAALLSVHTLKF